VIRTITDGAREQRVPVRVWAEHLSRETEQQLTLLASQPWVVGFVAAMADAHLSSGVAVGSVFATRSTVVPGALGGDLGCGMSAIRVAEETPDRDVLERILLDLGRAIPAGDESHRGSRLVTLGSLGEHALSTRALDRTRETLGPRHLGTLGGGNHFLELDRDADGALYLLVHSGSRGMGAAICMHHAHDARTLPKGQLLGLDTESEAGQAYVRDHDFALTFARRNREELARQALLVLGEHIGITPEPLTDIHHNFVAREPWLGEDLWIHRKGAIAASRNTLALVPGSMGSASYLVRGLGAEAAFGSCSHGAGRVMSRTEARAAVKPDALERAMRGVVFSQKMLRALVTEAPGAYRDIRAVLDAQAELVTKVTRLVPVLVHKG
jgi:tRNA-splicing ligase RtcB